MHRPVATSSRRAHRAAEPDLHAAAEGAARRHDQFVQARAVALRLTEVKLWLALEIAER